MNWEYLRSDEMAEAIEKSGGLCVLPIGCLESGLPTHRTDYLSELGVNVARGWAADQPNAFHGFSPHC